MLITASWSQKKSSTFMITTLLLMSTVQILYIFALKA